MEEQTETKMTRTARLAEAALKAADKAVVKTMNNVVARWHKRRQDIIAGMADSVRDELDEVGLLEPPDLALPRHPSQGNGRPRR